VDEAPAFMRSVGEACDCSNLGMIIVSIHCFDSLTSDWSASLLAMIMVTMMVLSRGLLIVTRVIPLLLLLPLLEFKLESTSCIQWLSV
jgi:hypothetical protein